MWASKSTSSGLTQRMLTTLAFSFSAACKAGASKVPKTRMAKPSPCLRNSADLGFASASYDQTVLFFLLHEMPEAVRAKTVAEALRVVKPGGKVIFCDMTDNYRVRPEPASFFPVLDRHAIV